MTGKFRWFLHPLPLVILPSALLATLLCGAIGGIFQPDPIAWLFLLSIWIILFDGVMSRWPVLLGVALRFSLKRQATIVPARPTGRSRLAILFPVRDEDPKRVCAAIASMADGLADHMTGPYRFFMLSDTREAAVVDREVAAVDALVARGIAVTHRHRAENACHKVGNVADFCARWGAEYDYMLVLDADCFMAGHTVSELVGLMDSQPHTGLIQIESAPVNSTTLYGRWQQFATRLYTPLWTCGTAWWQHDAGNYWGHNALIRIAPFVQHCELPILPGRAPFGGHILSHDVVEAGLLRRAGWHVVLWPAARDSYQETPGDFIGSLQRERRWCQGNLQHVQVLGMPGLHMANRLHLMRGVAYYVVSPLLLLTAVLPLAMASPDRKAAWALLVLMSVALNLVAALPSLGFALVEDRARDWGGRRRLVLSFLLDRAFSAIVLPVQVWQSCRFLFSILLGHDSGWKIQLREDRSVRWRDAWRQLRWLLPFAGLSMLIAVLTRSWWPVVPSISPILAVPFAVWTSRPAIGTAARHCGLFLTEDELHPSPVLTAYRERLAG